MSISKYAVGALFGALITKLAHDVSKEEDPQPYMDFACAASLQEGAKAKGVSGVPAGGTFSAKNGDCEYTADGFSLTYPVKKPVASPGNN